MALPNKPKRSPADGELPFEYDFEHPAAEVLTAYASLPLFVRALRWFDVPGSVKRHLHWKQRQRGFDEATYVESFLVLNALGGECLEDFDRLREDAGLAEMLGHELPSPEAARKFLYAFPEEERIAQAQAELPWDPLERRGGDVLDEVRYLVIRVRRQGVLFEEDVLSKHFAVVTNRFDFDAKRLLEWHREKAGTIEALHEVLKNGLAAGVMPCARFGANAAGAGLSNVAYGRILEPLWERLSARDVPESAFLSANE